MDFEFKILDLVMQRKQFLKLAVLSNFNFILKTNKFLVKKDFTFLDNVIYYKQGAAEYENLRKGFNKRIDKYPVIIALCKNTAGVAEAILYAKKNNLPVAIKSGGHCMEGFSCNNGGMVINLSLLNTIDWQTNNSIKVGPAVLLKDLYAAVLPKGKILPGGSCQSVALGGLTLGGGYGLLSRQLGLTCDSLTEITMVDGGGNIINSKNDNELLWACKGGGNGNFGVITEMKYNLHKAPLSMQSWRFREKNVSIEKAISILKNWFLISASLPNDCFSAFVINSKSIYILLASTNATTKNFQKQIDELTASTSVVTHSKLQPLQSALKVFYAESQPIYFKNASAGLYKNFADIELCIDKVITVLKSSPGMIYQINTLGGQVQNKTFEDISSFPHRDYNYFSELQTYYDTPAQASKLLKKFNEVQTIFELNGIIAQYRNYPDINFKNPLEGYYGKNLARLKAIKSKYDSTNVFSSPQGL